MFYSHFHKMSMSIDIGNNIDKIKLFFFKKLFRIIINPRNIKVICNFLSLGNCTVINCNKLGSIQFTPGTYLEF